MDAQLESSPVVVMVVAPSGYGKTTAMAQWARKTARDGVWLRVREGMADASGLVGALATELRDFGMLSEDNPLQSAPDALIGGAEPWGLLARGARRLEGDVVLAIDEAERLSDGVLNALLTTAMEVDGLSLRVTTRPSALPTPGSLAAVDVSLVDRSNLELTAEEAVALTGWEPSSPRISVLLANGAAPGIARAAKLGADSIAGLPWTPADAMRELVQLRVPAWDDRFAHFVEATSFAESQDAGLAARLSGDPGAEELLEHCVDEGLGYWNARPQAGERVFVYSPFIREAFERHARSRRREADIRDSVRAVARWNYQRGEFTAALRCALQCDDLHLASDIVRDGWFTLLRREHFVDELLRVPMARLRNFPLLSMLLAIRFNADSGSRLRALQYFALALYGVRAVGGPVPPSDRVFLRMLESAALRVSGRHGAAGRVALAATQALAELGPDGFDQLGRNLPTTYNQLGTSLFYIDRYSEALECFRQSSASSSALKLTAGLQGRALEAGTLALNGDMPEAGDAIARAEQANWPDGWKTGYPGSFLQVAYAATALEAGDAVAAQSFLRLLDPHHPALEHWPLVLHLDVVALVLQGRADEALVRVARARVEQSARQSLSTRNADRLRASEALALLATGDSGAARRVISGARPSPVRTTMLARAALANADAQQTLRLTAALPSSLTSSQRAHKLALDAAALSMTVPRDEHATTAVARLATFLDDRRLWLPLALLPSIALDALAQTESGAAPAFTAALARAHRDAAMANASTTPQLTDRERAVAGALSQFDTVAQVAEALSVSPNTVKTQLRSLYRKLEVRDRADALRALASLGMLDSGRER